MTAEKTKEVPLKAAELIRMPGSTHITMRRKQLAAFLEATGGQIMANGSLWDVTSKHLGAGVYRVSTKLWDGSERARRSK